MRPVTPESITDDVISAMSPDISARNREIAESLVRHLHDFCREVRPTYQEWLAACEFLWRAGDISDAKRNEFILISDALGVSILVDMLDHEVTQGETESSLLGPFYRENPPVLPMGASIVQKSFPNQETLLVRGQIRDTDGRAIAGATIDVWEDAPNGLYEQQDPEQPDYNLRGRFETDTEGHYAFVGLRPMPYTIPHDGAGGELLTYMGHHPWRPGHLHFMISKDGFRTLVTQIYDADTKYLESDTSFAVKPSLVGKMRPAPAELGTDLVMDFDFVLKSNELALAG